MVKILSGEKLKSHLLYLKETNFEPFEQSTGTPRSRTDSFDSDLAEDLSRSPLFAALRLLASRQGSAAGLH